MKYDAIIFDLFGTLVDNFPTAVFEELLVEIARIFDAPEQDFVRIWNIDTWPMRASGAFPTLEATFEHVCGMLGVKASVEQLQRAAQIRHDFTRRMLVPRPDVVETLTQLKAMGYKIGLISDCTQEVPEIWQSTPLAPLIDVAIFSCSVGLKKPDPRIYHLACERLGVQPQRCLYIGDGGSRELTGAISVGMEAVLIRVAYEEMQEIHRHEVQTWTGPRVAAVQEVLTLFH